MSTVRDNDLLPVDDDEEELIIDDPEELAEIEAAIAEADAHPGEGIELGELIQRLRNGE